MIKRLARTGCAQDCRDRQAIVGRRRGGRQVRRLPVLLGEPEQRAVGSPTVDSDGRPEYAMVCAGRSCRCGTARTGEHSQVSANAASCRYGISLSSIALSPATSATSSNRPFRATSTVASTRVGGPPWA